MALPDYTTQTAAQYKANIDALVTEGLWTPTLQDSSNNDAEGQTYSFQYGKYIKIGSTVFITGSIGMSSLGTLTGADAAKISGLPFASSATTYSDGSVHISAASNLSITALETVTGRITPNTNKIQLLSWDNAAGTTSLSISQVTASGFFVFSGQYNT